MDGASRQRLRGQFLDGDYFDEVGGGESAADARGARCRKDVVRTGGIIARRFGAAGADEDAAGMLDQRQNGAVMNGQMFGRERLEASAAASREGAMMTALFFRIASRATTAVVRVSSWRATSSTHTAGEFTGGGEEDRGGFGVMLGLG